jgi:thiol-disulfide isomerase/thioredoxin
MKRRLWLMGGAGTVAALAGTLWQQRREMQSKRQSELQQAQAPNADPTLSFWQMKFEKPDGGVLDVSKLQGKPLLLNFWGTWCPPCVKEMPELDRFARQLGPQGWQVLGLAVDKAQAVRDFLARSPVGYTIGLAGFEGTELSRQLGNSQAGLPFTVAFDAQGRVTHRKAGATTLEELLIWAKTS